MNVNVIYPQGVNGEVGSHESRIIAILAALQRGRGGYALEIGTFKGSTTSNIAANYGGKVVTVDLPPGDTAELAADKVDIQYYGAEKHFLPPYDQQIQQVLMDSAKLNLSPGIAFAFIDGCHTEEYVYNDFSKIEPCMIDGGTVLFHDYGSWAGVTNCINNQLTKRWDKHIWVHHFGTALVQCTICRV